MTWWKSTLLPQHRSKQTILSHWYLSCSGSVNTWTVPSSLGSCEGRQNFSQSCLELIFISQHSKAGLRQDVKHFRDGTSCHGKSSFASSGQTAVTCVSYRCSMLWKLKHFWSCNPLDRKKIPYTPKLMLYLFDAYKCYLYPTSAEVRTYLRHIPWEWQEQTVTWAKICISCVTDFTDIHRCSMNTRITTHTRYPSAKNTLSNSCPKIALKEHPQAWPSTAVALLGCIFPLRKKKKKPGFSNKEIATVHCSRPRCLA